MSQEQRCGNCRWWSSMEDTDGGDESEGHCSMMNSEIPEKDKEAVPVFKMSLAIAKASKLGSDAWVQTSRFFGCVMWEAKTDRESP